MSLRRAFSRLAPRIVGAISEAAIISEKNCTAVLRIGALPVGPQHAAVISLRQFRSSTSPCSSLLKTLQSEVEYEKENYNAPEVDEVPSSRLCRTSCLGALENPEDRYKQKRAPVCLIIAADLLSNILSKIQLGYCQFETSGFVAAGSCQRSTCPVQAARDSRRHSDNTDSGLPR